MITHKFDYSPLSRTHSQGRRYYQTPDGKKLPSVTTILDATTDKTFLREWRKRVGQKEAEKITRTSTGLGTSMHKMLEDYINSDTEPQGNLFARAMALRIIRKGLSQVDAVWGTEVPLYCPGLYAGTTDCVGLFRGKPAIIDFKNSRKPKKREWIGNYLEQLTAYAIAHNDVYGTDIRQGVIMLCTHDAEYQEFHLHGEDWDRVSADWARRVDTYYHKHMS